MKASVKLILVLVSLSCLFVFTGENAYSQSIYRRGGNTVKEDKKKEEAKPNKQTRPMNRPAHNRPSGELPSHNRPSGDRPSHNKPSHNRPPAHRPVPPVSHHPVRPIYPGHPMYPPHRPIYRPNHFNYGHFVHNLPFGAVKCIIGGTRYYYVGGTYYRPYRGRYVICRPPAGAIIASSLINAAVQLIAISIRDQQGNVRQYYTNNDGVYYQKQGGEYKVIEPPVGAIVEELPYGTEEMVINGETFYKVDDTFYQYVYDNGQGYYQVVGKKIK